MTSARDPAGERQLMAQRTIRFSYKSGIPWKAFRDEATGEWIGVCDALGVTTHGDDWAELMSVSKEIQQTLFSNLLRSGELNRFLLQHGWIPIDEIPPQPSDEELNFDLPNIFDQVSSNPAARDRNDARG
jgi:hypothetical protein